MALSRKSDITPEEQLLRLIEKPPGLADSSGQSEDAGTGLGFSKKGASRNLAGLIFAWPSRLAGGLRDKFSLKTVNLLCLVLVMILFGYAIWSAVAAETADVEDPSSNIPGVLDLTGAPDINRYYEEINKRSIFADMYKPPEVEVSSKPVAVTPVSSVVEIKPVMSDALKNVKLVGIIWEPQLLADGLILIDDGSEIRCLSRREMFRAKLEQSGEIKYINIEIKDIFKDRVVLKYEDNEQDLMLKD